VLRNQVGKIKIMDPIADFLNRIKNAEAVYHEIVKVPFSKVKFQIAKILENEGFIQGIEKRGRGTRKFIKIILKYNNDKTPALRDFKMISKPSRRVYVKSKDVKKVKGGFGIGIISTSKGLMTNKEAKRKKVGGEYICEIW